MYRVGGVIRLAARNLHGTSRLSAIQLKMPSLSPTMETGTIVAWSKKEGDRLAPGDVLCEIQTDKAVMGFEVDEEGTLAKILVPEGTADIAVGALIAVLAEDGEDWQEVEIPSVTAAAPKAAAKPSEAAKAAPKPSTSGPQRNDLMGPAVRLLLEQHQLQAADIVHSGPHGVLLKGDVMSHIKAMGSQPKAQIAAKPATATPAPTRVSIPGEGFTDTPLSNMRKTIAKRLTQSKQQSPHAYASIDVNMGSVNALRNTLKAEGVKVSVNDFIVKAVAATLRAVPEVNIQIAGGEIQLMEEVSVSVAVATPSGLITPIVPNADRLSVTQIAEKIRELAGRAKDNKLKPEEFIGGTCTVSNLGMFGISDFTAIINPPQGAILAVGGARNTLGLDLSSRQMVALTLCFDQRGIGEEAAAYFLATLRDFLSDPDLMLLGQRAKVAQAL